MPEPIDPRITSQHQPITISDARGVGTVVALERRREADARALEALEDRDPERWDGMS